MHYVGTPHRSFHFMAKAVVMRFFSLYHGCKFFVVGFTLDTAYFVGTNGSTFAARIILVTNLNEM